MSWIERDFERLLDLYDTRNNQICLEQGEGGGGGGGGVILVQLNFDFSSLFPSYCS